MNLSPELVLLLKFFLCGGLLLLCFRLTGLVGLYLYTGITVIASNVAVLKQVQFSFYPTSMAVGTVLFTSLFLCSDIINEYYGKRAALKAVLYGFLSYFLMTIFMMSVLAYGDAASSPETHAAIQILFLPAPALFVSSLIAYFTSQYTDIFIFRFIRRQTGTAQLGLRTLLSSLIASFLDNAIFSFFAWYVFALNAATFSEIFWKYIFGTSILRVLLSFGNVGFIYLSRFCKPRSHDIPTIS